MSEKRYTYSNTTVFNIGYHLIWCPKYRRSVLEGDVHKRLKELLKEKAKDIQIEISEMEILPDHVHLFVKAQPTQSPHYLVQQLKGYSSHELRKEFPKLKSRLPTLWTRSYYAESVGTFPKKRLKSTFKTKRINENLHV